MSASIRPLPWDAAQRPQCQARGCQNPAFWVIRFPVVRRGRPSSRSLWRCNVHGREFAERHDLVYPPAVSA